MIVLRVFVCVEPCYINLFFPYRFEAIFNWHFNATYTINTEPMWHHMSALQAKFKVPTYKVVRGMLTPMDKECMGSHPKMFFALDELLYVYQCINNTDVWHVIAYEILSFASDRCTEWHNRRLKPECDTFGPAMPHIILGDIRNLERLTWAIYDGMFVQKVDRHFQVRITGTVSSTRQWPIFFMGECCGSTAPK